MCFEEASRIGIKISFIKIAGIFSRGESTGAIQSTPDNPNLQGKSKKVRVIGSSKKIAESKVKNSFYCTVNIVITFYRRNVK